MDVKVKNRGYESFHWVNVDRLKMMVGFGWSSCWMTLTPWTVDGKSRPYVGITSEGKSSRLRWRVLWLGPACVQIAYLKKDYPK